LRQEGAWPSAYFATHDIQRDRVALWRFNPFAEKGGGLWECCICLLVLEESYFLMPPFNSCAGQQKIAYTKEVELA